MPLIFLISLRAAAAAADCLPPLHYARYALQDTFHAFFRLDYAIISFEITGVAYAHHAHIYMLCAY